MSKLENTVIKKATALLLRLEEQLTDKSGEVERSDIHTTADYIFSLVELSEQTDCGLSEKGIRDLQQINVRALHLLRTSITN